MGTRARAVAVRAQRELSNPVSKSDAVNRDTLGQCFRWWIDLSSSLSTTWEWSASWSDAGPACSCSTAAGERSPVHHVVFSYSVSALVTFGQFIVRWYFPERVLASASCQTCKAWRCELFSDAPNLPQATARTLQVELGKFPLIAFALSLSSISCSPSLLRCWLNILFDNHLSEIRKERKKKRSTRTRTFAFSSPSWSPESLGSQPRTSSSLRTWLVLRSVFLMAACQIVSNQLPLKKKTKKNTLFMQFCQSVGHPSRLSCPNATSKAREEMLQSKRRLYVMASIVTCPWSF